MKTNNNDVVNIGFSDEKLQLLYPSKHTSGRLHRKHRFSTIEIYRKLKIVLNNFDILYTQIFIRIIFPKTTISLPYAQI